MPLRFRVCLLGPVEVRSGQEAVPLGRRERAVVALLALHAGSVVSVSRIVDELWPEGTPKTASNIVQGVVSRLRRSLGPDAVTTTGSGYVLSRTCADTDLDEFEGLAAAGRSALPDRPNEAARQLRQALTLWYGEPLSDLQELRFAQLEAVRLQERRMLIVEERVAADVASGAGPTILDELADLEGRYPFREGLVATRMRALTQGGRRVEALDAYAAFRRRLVDETGLEPTAALRGLHQSLLDDEPDSLPPPEGNAPAQNGLSISGAGGPSRDRKLEAPDLPSGTVTLLFSDIQGSTALVLRLGPAYAEALAEQRRILREAWALHGGTELSTEGDSFYVVFSTAGSAVAAAAHAQRALQTYPWPREARVRVRMGLHSGSPTVHDGAYVGLDVHRAARIAAAAHGGQVVISRATSELAQSGLPEGVTLRDLGSHRLRDLPAAEHLYQLTIDGCVNDFPPLKSLGAASSLPRPRTSLIGREGELTVLRSMAKSSEVSLVTLIGPGGSGKTRLAVEVARHMVDRFPDGVFFVPLATAANAESMWECIGGVLDVPLEHRKASAVSAQLAHRSALFVLDNLEHLEGADRVVADLLEAAPHVVVIATSRRPLHVSGEREFPVPPLLLAEGNDVNAASASSAVQLFVHQADLVQPGFTLTEGNVADVVEVCSRLDGLPLAIELAAARIKLLTPRALLARLDSALDIVGPGAHRPARQKTLRNTIDWSYQLLNTDQQALFRRLGVFTGSADLDAVTAVTADIVGHSDPLDLITHLVDASLATMVPGPGGEPRIDMLEIIRSYARDLLATTGELDTARRRHAQHYLEVIQRLSLLLFGEQHLVARTSFETDHDNFRQALAWATDADQTAAAPDGRDELRLAIQRWRW
jgi:predicted ATPase/class 3 adenylate cyclase/DNA-binding SARP family transcriptional activator